MEYAITLRHTPFPIDVRFYLSSDQTAALPGRSVYIMNLTATVRDRDTGETSYFGRMDVLHLAVVTPEKIAQHARELLHEWLAHEADEWLHVDGVRVFDPHKED